MGRHGKFFFFWGGALAKRLKTAVVSFSCDKKNDLLYIENLNKYLIGSQNKI